MKSEFSNKMNNRAPVLGRANLLERYLKSNTHDWALLRFMIIENRPKRKRIKRSISIRINKLSKSIKRKGC